MEQERRYTYSKLVDDEDDCYQARRPRVICSYITLLIMFICFIAFTLLGIQATRNYNVKTINSETLTVNKSEYKRNCSHLVYQDVEGENVLTWLQLSDIPYYPPVFDINGNEICDYKISKGKREDQTSKFLSYGCEQLKNFKNICKLEERANFIKLHQELCSSLPNNEEYDYEFKVEQYDKNNLNIYSFLKIKNCNGKKIIEKEIITINGTKKGETWLLDVNMYLDVAYNFLISRASFLTLFQNTFETISKMVTLLNGGNDPIRIKETMRGVIEDLEKEKAEKSYIFAKNMKRYFVGHSLGGGIASYSTEYYNRLEAPNKYVYGISINPPSMKNVAFKEKEYYRGYVHSIVAEIEVLSSAGRKITDKITQIPCEKTLIQCHCLANLISVFGSQEDVKTCKNNS